MTEIFRMKYHMPKPQILPPMEAPAGMWDLQFRVEQLEEKANSQAKIMASLRAQISSLKRVRHD